MPLPNVHLITDREICPDPVSAARVALAGLAPGTVAVHLREKGLGGRELLALARTLGEAVHELGQLVLVNDRVDVALAAEADGVHLPSAGVSAGDARRLLGSDRLIGVSCHGTEDVRSARDAGADYATFGPVFDTPSKRRYGAPVGLAALRDAGALGLPLVGLGGIDLSNAADVIAAGARGIAVIRAWLAAADASAAVRALVSAARG